MADAQTPVLTDEAAPIGYVRKTDLPVAKERGALMFRTPDADWSTPVYLGAPPAQPGEPVAWRSRHRSEIGMIGHYPWSFMERAPKSAMRGSFEVQPLYTHPAPSQPDRAVMQRVRDAITGYHLALDRREHGGVAAGRALDIIQDVLGMPWVHGAALSATMEKPHGN